MSGHSDLCSPLPNVTSMCNVPVCQNHEQGVIDFLESTLPASDCKRIPDELRKTFVFNKFKVKRKEKVNDERINCTFLSRRKLKRHPSICNISKKRMKYSEIYPLNQLWLNYMRDLLDITSFANMPSSSENPNWENVNQQLQRADFHGAKITIHKSRCASLVGLTGIVVKDTKSTFTICGTDNFMKMIPKTHVVIHVHMGDGIMLKVLGKHLCIRPVERAVKKSRNVEAIQL